MIDGQVVDMQCAPFSDDQLEVMLGAMPSLRDQALFALGVSTGLRISELLQIRRRDLIDNTGELRHMVTVYHTKGDKMRTVPINPLATPFLGAWLRYQQEIGLELGNCPVFAYSTGKPIGRNYAWLLIARTARRAKLRPEWHGTIGTHSMRKTYARATYTYWQERQMGGERVEPLVKVQEALGHQNIDSTRRYLSFMLGDISEGAMALYPTLRDQGQNHKASKIPLKSYKTKRNLTQLNEV